MPTIIKPKRSEAANAVPTSNDLEVGEIAINTVDRIIYTKNSSNEVIIIGQYVPAGADPSYLIRSNSLSDVPSISDARTNLDVDSSQEVTDKAINNGIIFSIALG